MNAVPKTPLILGIGGVLPFAALALALWLLPSGHVPLMSVWLVGYGAVILTFVGALHWGVAMVHPEVPERDRGLLMVWSVVPAIVAWIALSLSPLTALGVLAAMFLVQFEADRRLDRRFPVTRWFLRLRARLTAAVVLCIVLAALSLLHR